MVAAIDQKLAIRKPLAVRVHVHRGEGMSSRGTAPRHVSQILPDVLARYGITPESVEQSAVAERYGPVLEFATVEGNPAACAAGCW
jgi:hypothetical protein